MDIKNYNYSGYLEGHLLVATNVLKGSYFEKSVVYMCMHNKDGAMGILVNHVLENLTCSDIFDELKIQENSIKCNTPVHFGGPVSSGRGFILHTSDYRCKSTHYLHNNFSITSTVDILHDIATGKGPEQSIVALGYAGWKAGQLEKEILENAWIYAPADEQTIFKTANNLKWSKCTEDLGIDIDKLSVTVGNA